MMKSHSNWILLFFSLFFLQQTEPGHASMQLDSVAFDLGSPAPSPYGASPNCQPVPAPSSSWGAASPYHASPDAQPAASPAPAPAPGGPSASQGPAADLFSGPGLGLSTIQSVLHSAPHDPALDRICGSTDYPDLCFPAIIPAVKGGKADLHVVVGSAIKAVMAQTELAVATATKLLRNAPPKMASALGDCKSSYGDAMDNLKQAMDALKSNDIGTVNTMLSAAITYSGDCTDGLEGQSSPLVDFNKKLRHMTSNCLAIAALMK